MSIYKQKGLPVVRRLPTEDQTKYNEEPVFVPTDTKEEQEKQPKKVAKNEQI